MCAAPTSTRSATVFDGLVVRILAGLAAARAVARRRRGGGHASSTSARSRPRSPSLDHPARRRTPAVLERLADQSRAWPGAGPGDAAAARCRLAGRRAGRAAAWRGRSRGGTPPAVGAAFVEGFLAGIGHGARARRRSPRDRRSLAVVAAPTSFDGVVPLLRGRSARSSRPNGASSGAAGRGDSASVARRSATGRRRRCRSDRTVRHMLGLPVNHERERRCDRSAGVATERLALAGARRHRAASALAARAR